MNLDNYYNILKKEYVGWDNQYQFVINNIKKDTPFAYVRFNDGEMMGIDKIGSVVARGDQYVTEELHIALKESISHKQENYYIGIPCSSCFNNYNKLANNLIGDYEYKVSAVALTNRNWAKFISEISNAIGNKPIRFISGNDQNLDFLKNKMNFNIVNHTHLQAKNSWSQKDNLSNYLENVNDGDIVMISLGPTARILCRKWFELRPKVTFIDIGSTLDPFTRNVWHNCHRNWETGFNSTNRCKVCN